jgi:hypothetical protein
MIGETPTANLITVVLKYPCYNARWSTPHGVYVATPEPKCLEQVNNHWNIRSVSGTFTCVDVGDAFGQMFMDRYPTQYE